MKGSASARPETARAVSGLAQYIDSASVGLRICFVTPFAWSQPHEVNTHVAGAAAALRRLGHEVTVLAPSNRTRDLLDGRRALQRGTDAEVIAVGPSIPISRRSSMGVPVGVRANLTLALARGRYDVVHGFEPGLPSLSYLALTTTHALTAATFFSADRLSYPPRRSRRDRLRARVDALLATSPATATAAAERFEGDYALIPLGVDSSLFRPGEKQRTIALELEPGGRSTMRALARLLRELPGWELTLLHTKPLGFRPPVPRDVRKRVHVRSVRRPAQRAAALGDASIFVPATEGEERLRLEAATAGAAIVEDGPEVAARVGALAADEAALARVAKDSVIDGASFDDVARELDAVYSRLVRKPHRRTDEGDDPLEGREWIVVDLHMHTDWSHDCSTPTADLLEHAEQIGLGGIAITDHNAFGGALEGVELARGRELIVIPGEEVKTDGQGEVIGLFLEEEIPRGMSFADTIAAIREQGGLVYLPHPFDRLHSIPDPATLHRHLAEIDVFEVFNARLLRDSFNDEALRFARKYRLLQGAGSDAHVLQGVGTGAVRMRRFDGAEEFLLSLRTAEVLRRPKSLAYLQSLKWVAQVKEKVR
jgi:predicted metal-dependent phosphoesterase TrpH/glycosyltransferase involved in cell wall biosynthesis